VTPEEFDYIIGMQKPEEQKKDYDQQPEEAKEEAAWSISDFHRDILQIKNSLLGPDMGSNIFKALSSVKNELSSLIDSNQDTSEELL
jgi:hypothetical protein